MKTYPDGNVQMFWLLSQNVSGGPASQADAMTWHQDSGLGGAPNTTTLVDGAQTGFMALFPDRPGTDGSLVLEVGTLITAIDTKDPATAIADALQ